MTRQSVIARASGRDPTLIGKVRHVMGATITVELSEDVAGSTPLFQGRVYHIGQIGSLATISKGPITLIGAVSMLGISELVTPLEPSHAPSQGERWLRIQLLGEIDAMGRFQRGVSTFPSLDDEVRFATSNELTSIYPGAQPGFIPVGRLSTSRSEILRIDLAKLVTRHSAIIGSTGSGKSSTVAKIIQSVISCGLKRANIVVIDPHGEYQAAFGDAANVMTVDGTSSNALNVPYWSLGLDDFIRAFVGPGTRVSPIVRNKIQELILDGRKKYLKNAGWKTPSADDITVDTPIPYDIRQLWFDLDFNNRGTSHQSKNSGNFAVKEEGNPLEMKQTQFEPYAHGGPYQCSTYGQYNPVPDRIFVRLKDPLFSFLVREFPDPTKTDPLPECISGWLGYDLPISVMDFSGIPSEAADVAIGAVLTLLFEMATSCPQGEGIGRARPVLIVLEEAHRFIGQSVSETAGAAKSAAERIAREGRKYGLGIMIVSQRPAELSETTLSQCGSFISMRLSNPGDQARIRSALPDTVANLADALPALRTGEALVTGEAISLPSRVLIDKPSPEPSAKDASLDTWKGQPIANDVVKAVSYWRGINKADSA